MHEILKRIRNRVGNVDHKFIQIYIINSSILILTEKIKELHSLEKLLSERGDNHRNTFFYVKKQVELLFTRDNMFSNINMYQYLREILRLSNIGRKEKEPKELMLKSNAENVEAKYTENGINSLKHYFVIF